MMKAYIALLILALSCIAHGSAGRGRQAKLDRIWHNLRQETGMGSAASVGTAGGLRSGQRSLSVQCTETGFFPTTGSCQAFHRCVDFSGRRTFFSVFHFYCPLGTIFDDNLDICNHPNWVVGRPECGGTGTALLPIVSTSIPSIQTSGHPQTVGSAVDITTQVSPKESEDTTSQSNSAPTVVTEVNGDLLQCYDDNVYREHPKYCNKYYYCSYEPDSLSVPVFTCPVDLVFNEQTQSCVSQNEVVCSSSLAPYPTPIVLTTAASAQTTPSEFTTGFPIDITTKKTWEVHPNSRHPCPAPGYYPFEGDCIRFYKCVETDDGQLLELLYKCSENYGYSEEIHRCQKVEHLPPCKRSLQRPHLRLETATQLYEEDLVWFFNNKK